MGTGEYIHEMRHNTQRAHEFFAEKLAYTLGPVELGAMLESNKVKLIDVRYKADYEASHIPQAINIEKDELLSRMGELSRSDVHVVCCYNQQCHLGANAALILTGEGFPAMELEGGFKVWKEEFNFPTT